MAVKSKGFWQEIKNKSQEWLEKVKAKIHDVTAPDPQ
jgi:hypothetical protein